MQFKPSKPYEEFISSTVLGQKPIMEIAIEGPKGEGKTLAARNLFDSLRAKDPDYQDNYYRLVITKETSFMDLTVEKSVKDGSVVEKTMLALQMVEKPSVLVVDEYKSGQPDVLLGLNSLLDFDRALTLPSGKVFKRHPKSVIVFTSNPQGYAGVKKQHGGFIDRLPTFNMGYNPNVATILKENYPTLAPDLILKIVKLRDLLISSEKMKGTTTTLSTRGCEMMCNLLLNGCSIPSALSITLKPIPEEELTVSELAKLAMNAVILKNEKGEDELSLLEGLRKDNETLKRDIELAKAEVTRWKEKVNEIFNTVKQ